MSMADLAGATETLALPDDPRSLGEMLENLPRFAETMSSRMHHVAEWMKETRIHEDITGPMEDLANAMSQVEDAAEEAYESFLEHYPPEFWAQ